MFKSIVLAGCLAAASVTGLVMAGEASSRVNALGVTSARSQIAVCPNPEGGACLGKLRAGTYTTTVFQPAITYTVPRGWSNFEDTPGNFLLVPPQGNLPGVNAGTSDFIGIYTSIAAAAPGCAPGPSQTVADTPLAITHWIRRNPGLTASAPASASIGGLHGLVLDIKMRAGWKKPCPYSNGHPTVQLITGVAPSGLDHGLGPRGLVIRLYLLKRNNGTLGIEVDDLAGGRHLATYSSIVKRIRFAA